MKKQLIYWLAAVLVIAIGCQKELSFEGANTPAKGTLQSDVTGDCLPKTVNGAYIAATPLVPATNTITVQVNVTQTGTFVITTDTVNGYYFRATGTFTTLGLTTVTLRSNGTPFAAGVNNFVVSFDGSVCDIAVTVLPVGSGPAVFTLVSGGTPNNCASAVVSGVYAKDVPLNATTNYVDISVNVTTIGSYTITATGGGMTFTKTGIFASTGNQPVRLVGSGTPTIVGSNTETFAAPFASCNFVVTVVGPPVYTIDCPNVIVNGTYQAGTPLSPANTIVLPITVTTAGPYNISASINGMTFSGSGTLTLASTSITLTGTGTPTAAGTFNISVGTPACSIPIQCTAAPSIDWKFTMGTTTYQGSTALLGVTFDNSTPPFTLLNYSGTNAAPDDFSFSLIDLIGGINANETYNSNSIGTTNIGAFYFLNAGGTLNLTADPSTPTMLIIFKITSHNTATHTIIGTFSGTAFDSVSSTTKTITNGIFTAIYP